MLTTWETGWTAEQLQQNNSVSLSPGVSVRAALTLTGQLRRLGQDRSDVERRGSRREDLMKHGL